MADDFEEIANAFEELADTLQQETDDTGLPSEEPLDEGPDVPDLNMDVPGEPEYDFPSMKQLAETFDTTVEELRASVPEDVWEDGAFWAFISQQAGTPTTIAPLERPLSDDNDEGPTAVEVIRETTIAEVAEVGENEGRVDLPTTAAEVESATEQTFIEALTGVRSRDQKLDNLHEARENIGAAMSVAMQRLEAYREDREKLQKAVGLGDGDVDVMTQLLDVLDDRIDEGEEVIAEGEEKLQRIEDRAEDIVADRNEYRAYVKAVIRRARGDDESPLQGRVDEVYRGYRIRSGRDVPFRTRVVKKVLVFIKVRNNRGDTWVTTDYLVKRGREVNDFSKEQVASAVNLLLTTGEIIKRDNEVRLEPMIEA